MTLAQLVSEYGYLALAIGCFLEGETVVLLAGLAAHRGLLQLPDVAMIAIGCGFCGDQCWYHLGRRFGTRLISRFPALSKRKPWLEQHVFAHPDLLVLGLRFMVGFRTVGPILMGSGFVQPRRFFWLNLLGAVIWATVFVSLGYFFGEAAERLLPDIQSAEEKLFLGLLGLALVVQLARHWGKRSRKIDRTDY